jgi:hypothetical protein
LSPRVIPYAGSLVTLNSLVVTLDLDLSNAAQALCQSGLSLFQLRITAPDKFLGSAAELKTVGPQAAPLLAMGLVNTLIDAKQEEALERRDTLLQELRQLAQAYPQDAAVRTIVGVIDP